jgi:hypothetical protein
VPHVFGIENQHRPKDLKKNKFISKVFKDFGRNLRKDVLELFITKND